MLTILTSFSVKGLQAVNVDLGYFTTSSYGSINCINLSYSVRAYPLGSQLAGPTPTYSLIKKQVHLPWRLIIVFVALTLTRDQILVGVVMKCLQSASEFGNIIIIDIEVQADSLERRVRQRDVRTATQRGRTQWRNVRWYCTRKLQKEPTHPSWSGPHLHKVWGTQPAHDDSVQYSFAIRCETQ